MRDTLLIVGILALILLGFSAVRKVSSQTPSPLALTTKGNGKTGGVHAKQRSSVESHFADPSSGENEGSTGEAESAQGLPSIYSRDSVGRGNQDPQSGVKSAKAKAKRGKVLLGVPVDDFLASSRDRLATGRLAADDSGALRVYLQCVDVTEKPQAVGERRCDELYTGNDIARAAKR